MQVRLCFCAASGWRISCLIAPGKFYSPNVCYKKQHQSLDGYFREHFIKFRFLRIINFLARFARNKFKFRDKKCNEYLCLNSTQNVFKLCKFQNCFLFALIFLSTIAAIFLNFIYFYTVNIQLIKTTKRTNHSESIIFQSQLKDVGAVSASNQLNTSN